MTQNRLAGINTLCPHVGRVVLCFILSPPVFLLLQATSTDDGGFRL